MKYVALFLLLNLGCVSVYSQNSNHFKKVVWIVFENEDYVNVAKQPDFAKFLTYGVNFTQMRAEAHPSQGNYISMIAGSSLGVVNDKPVNLQANHVGDLLENHHMDWRVYAEDYPNNCFTGATYANYVRKHVPFVSFTNVTSNPQRCAKITNEKTFFEDYKNNLLPEFTMYVPNLQNDGHDTGVDFAGKWLTQKFGSILSHPENLNDTLFILTFDESNPDSQANQIYTVLIGSCIQKGISNSQKLNHFALLRMIEVEYGLENLGRQDVAAPVIQNIWKN